MTVWIQLSSQRVGIFRENQGQLMNEGLQSSLAGNGVFKIYVRFQGNIFMPLS